MKSDMDYTVQYYEQIPKNKLQFRCYYLKLILEEHSLFFYSDLDNYKQEEFEAEIRRLEPDFYRWAEHFRHNQINKKRASRMKVRRVRE